MSSLQWSLRVCGRLRGYQFGGTDAFNASIVEYYTSVDSNYVDTIMVWQESSLTRGNVRKVLFNKE